MAKNLVVIRTDSSVNIGNGHMMRCLTLAEELISRDYEVLFLCRLIEAHLVDLLSNKDIELSLIDLPEYVGDSTESLWSDYEQNRDAENCQNILKGRQVKALLVDHYGLNAVWESLFKNFADKIMVIDDLANRTHDCDILLDQNFYLDKNRYEELTPPTCLKLEGPFYSLLRSEFTQVQPILKESSRIRIFMFFGSADLLNLTSFALQSIQSLNSLDLQVDVVIGKSNPHRKQVEEICENQPAFKLYIQVNYMAELMSQAHLSIGAGGTVNWERFYLGLPALVVSVAENQVKSSEDLAESGLIHYLGHYHKVTQKDISEKLKEILNQPEELKKLSDKVKALVDGKGVSRVVDELMKI
ncbi:MAG: UDP-2,4-diacetamido-2,4,6-trideoxy-beta-L-altropyranose hydrolase [Lentisphaeraceae bacterium]|nr:UDP-2,4-diacetamido-2,4,6-trideoxy-beta-L-altropyranose hydrolase [Lentisphaeraceae bacterium]